MSERLDEFGDTQVVVVTFTEPSRLPAYIEHLGIHFTVVTDVDRKLYRALGLERGSFTDVWGIGTLKMYWDLLRHRGRTLRRTDEDVRQLGADVVVDPTGRFVEIFRPPTPASRPTVDELLHAISRAS